VIDDHGKEDRDPDHGMYEPTRRRSHEVGGDTDNRPHVLLREPIRGHTGLDELRMAGKIGEQGHPGGRHEPGDNRIERDCRALVRQRAGLIGLGQHACRKGKECGGAQYSKIDPVQPGIDLGHVLKQAW
jgi:hypothetical protein